MNGSVSRLVVCGTDTDVGKTVVSALLVQGLQASYWKPVQSGLEGGGVEQWDDLDAAYSTGSLQGSVAMIIALVDVYPFDTDHALPANTGHVA